MIDETLARLDELGVMLEPIPGGRIRWAARPELSAEARDLIEELRRRKPAVFAELVRWDEPREWRRLQTAFRWADAEPRRQGVTWAQAWAAAPDEIRRHLDEDLDAINGAWSAADVLAHCAALESFRRTVAVVLQLQRLESDAAEDRPLEADGVRR